MSVIFCLPLDKKHGTFVSVCAYLFLQRVRAFFEGADCSLFTPCYHCNLIKLVPDDNKFVDCAVVANAKFIVTENRHFDSVKRWYTLLYIADISFISALTS